MAFTLIQAGTSLQMLDTAGNVGTLSLPTGVTLSSSRVPRFAIFGRYVVMVNSPSRPLTIDPLGVVRVLTPRPPTTRPTLSGISGGSLTGTYQVKQTFRIKDADGNVISESDYGAVAAAASITAQQLQAAGLDVSPDAISSSMLYRTATSGAVYYPWIELDGNTQTLIADDLSDASLTLLAAPTLGSAPDLMLVCEWRGRLWGVDRTFVDELRWTEAESMYQWGADNGFEIPRPGSDARGVTGLIARKESLITGRQNIVHQITGESNDDFRPVKISDQTGVESHESLAVYNDVVYWLWKDGVYELDGGVVKCISDGSSGKGNVRSWFVTDSYFNRAQFKNAFAHIIPSRKVYRLFLCSAGSNTVDRFVDFDMINRTWWGPHTISGLTPSAAFQLSDANDLIIPVVGMTTGRLHKEQTTRTDDTGTGIALDIITKRHDENTPMIDKYFGRVTMAGIAQSSGRLLVTPAVGEIDAVQKTQPLQFDLTKNAEDLGRLGTGKACQLELTEATPGQDVKLTGYEIDVSELGQRI